MANESVFLAMPGFASLDLTDYEDQLKALLAHSHERIEKLLLFFQEKADQEPTWDNLMIPLEEMLDKIHLFWSPVSHLHGVKNDEALRAVFGVCLPLIIQFYSELGQNKGLFDLIERLTKTAAYLSYSAAQKELITHKLRDFRLQGVDLPEEEQVKFQSLRKKLSELSTQFDNHVLDATQSWSLLLSEEQVKGIPETALLLASEKAKAKGEEGYLFSLDYPSYHAVMTYAEDRSIREKFYRAYVTRASDLSVSEIKQDNSAIMDEILEIRHEMAKLLGYTQFSDYALVTRMAESVEEVKTFLSDLIAKAKPLAEKEIASLSDFAAKNFGVADLQVHDIPFFSEKQKQALYEVSQETLRAFFEEKRVLQGLFSVCERLFDIQFELYPLDSLWDQSVQFYLIKSKEKQEVLGGLFMDLYTREFKRQGAWMDDAVSRRKIEEKIQKPIAYLTCNFAPPSASKPALLTHHEVETLFHEMGHCLHHLLTEVDYPEVGGIAGVPWDAVELPSQFLENWCWDYESLKQFAVHYETNELLSEALWNKVQAGKNFHSALFLLRQIEFALFDIRIHSEYKGSENTKPSFIQSVLDEVRKETAVIKVPSFNRFQHSFSHIFAGGYAAGYYSYLWAERLASDAFERFATEGIFNKELGQAFRNKILAKGGSAPFLELFISFRGRPPQNEALLKHYGLQ